MAFFKVLVAAAVVACAVAAPAGPPAPYHAPAPYHPAPAHYADPIITPPVYDFQYGVNDPHYGPVFSHSENRNNYDTKGEYRVNLPDGRVQIVSYSAGPDGYVADVSYEGEAAYPDTPAYKPAHKPAYAPHPAPAPYKPAPAPVYKPAPAPVYHKPAPVYKPHPAPYHPAPAYHKPAPVYHKPAVYAPHPAPVYKAKPRYSFSVVTTPAPEAREAKAAPVEEEPAEEVAAAPAEE